MRAAPELRCLGAIAEAVRANRPVWCSAESADHRRWAGAPCNGRRCWPDPCLCCLRPRREARPVCLAVRAFCCSQAVFAHQKSGRRSKWPPRQTSSAVPAQTAVLGRVAACAAGVALAAPPQALQWWVCSFCRCCCWMSWDNGEINVVLGEHRWQGACGVQGSRLRVSTLPLMPDFSPAMGLVMRTVTLTDWLTGSTLLATRAITAFCAACSSST